MAYSASKSAVRVMTYAIAAQLGHAGIRANVVHPGTIRTTMTVGDNARLDPEDEASMEAFVEDIPAGRVGTPGDVADVVAFLASDRSSYVNAASVVVDGGRGNTL